MKIITKEAVLAAGLALAACGCESLPPGDPPEGWIVDTGTEKIEMTEKNAVNHMVTSMMTKCDRFNKGAAPRIKGDFKGNGEELKRPAEKVLGELSAMGVATVARNGDEELVLESRMKKSRDGKKEWNMSLKTIQGNKIEWSETIIMNSGEAAKK